TKGSDVGYQFVTVSETDKGKTVFQYTSPIDKPNPLLPNTLPPFTGAPNHDHLRGNLLNVKNYNSSGVLLTEDIYEYNHYLSNVSTGIVIHPSTYLYGSEHNNHEEFLTWRQNQGLTLGYDDMANLTFERLKEYVGNVNMIKETKIQYLGSQPITQINNNE